MVCSSNNAVAGSRAIKAHVGALALLAALAAGAGATMAASLFGSLTALALGASAALAASFELVETDRHRRWRIALWSMLMAGWFSLAALLLDLPLIHLTGVRLWSSVLVVVGAALRAQRYQTHCGGTTPGLVMALALALCALAIIWGTGLLPLGGTAAAAISIGCAVELFGSGTFWLGEASAARWPTLNPTPGSLPVRAAIPLA